MPDAANSIPPYVPYRTFRNFLEQLREGIPARIDRSVWGARYSGSSGIQLMTALKVLELVDEDGRPQPRLEQLVKAEGDERRRLLRSILEAHYPELFELDLSRATRSQFAEVFRGYSQREGVIRKCENFFVQAAQDAGVDLSSFILARRHGARRTAASPRTRPAGTPQPATSRSRSTSANDISITLAEMVLAKYPDFDPSWSPGVQEKWFDGLTRLYETLGSRAPSPGRGGGADSGAAPER